MIRSQRGYIIEVAKKYGASHVQIFGSVARREENNDSDIDILVLLPKGYDMFKQRLPLQEELEKIIGKNIDLIIKHEINRHFKASILSNAMDL